MIHWIKDALDAAKAVRAVRKGGYKDKLFVGLDENLKDFNAEFARIKADNQLMQKCIRESAENSPCHYCEDYEECRKLGKPTTMACDGWWLMFPKKEKQDGD